MIVVCVCVVCVCVCLFFCQAEDGIRDLVRSRGLGDVYKRQVYLIFLVAYPGPWRHKLWFGALGLLSIHLINAIRVAVLCVVAAIDYDWFNFNHDYTCLLYTSDAADERSRVDLGGRRIIKKQIRPVTFYYTTTYKH